MNFDLISERLGGVCAPGSGPFCPMTEMEIARIENQIGAELPTTYRSMLTTFGGFTFNGRSEDDPFIFFRSVTPLPKYITGNGFAIFAFFYGCTRETGPLGLDQQLNYFKDRIPETMIPIANDKGAGEICLGVKGNDRGKVFYWDMKGEPLDEETYLEDFGEPMPLEAKRANVYLVANSFEEFLGQLVLTPDEMRL